MPLDQRSGFPPPPKLKTQVRDVVKKKCWPGQARVAAARCHPPLYWVYCMCNVHLVGFTQYHKVFSAAHMSWGARQAERTEQAEGRIGARRHTYSN